MNPLHSQSRRSWVEPDGSRKVVPYSEVVSRTNRSMVATTVAFSIELSRCASDSGIASVARGGTNLEQWMTGNQNRVPC